MTTIVEEVEQTVLNGYNTLYGLGSSAFNQASSALNSLTSLNLPQPPQINLPNFDSLQVQFQQPADPQYPSLDFQLPDLPDTPDTVLPDIPSAGQEPQFTDDPPILNLPPQPAAFTDQAPNAPSVDTNIELPSAPTVNLPTQPTLSAIDLPSAPDVQVPDFTAIPPIPPAAPPVPGLSYSEPGYSLTLPQVQTAISTFLSGQDGLPPEVEQALFDRARVREDMAAIKAVEEATEEWSARGFSLPQGELNRRIDEARARNQNAASQLNRDTSIQQRELMFENLRFAVQQGIAYEAQMIDLYNQISSRKLEAARETARLGIEYFNAVVSLYNAEVTAFNAQAEAYRTKIAANAQKIEVYRGQLEAARLKGELNQQQIQIYSESVRAQATAVELYKGQVEAARAKVEATRAQIDVYRAQVEGFAARVEANRAQFQAWGEAVRAEGQKLDIYRTAVSAYAERLRAYNLHLDAMYRPVTVKMDVERLKIEAFQNKLAGLKEQINAKVQDLQTKVSVFETLVRGFEAKLSLGVEQYRTKVEEYSAKINALRNQASVAIENARLASENAGRNASLALEAQRGVAQVGAQLAVGTLSALNLSAHLNAGANFSEGQSTNVNYSVDGGAGSPPTFS